MPASPTHAAVNIAERGALEDSVGEYLGFPKNGRFYPCGQPLTAEQLRQIAAILDDNTR